MVSMIRGTNSDRLRLAIHAAGLLYVFGIAALLIANHFLRQASPFVALASTFNLFLFVAALPLAFCLLLMRTRMAFGTLLLLLILFLTTSPLFPQLLAMLPAKNAGAPVSMMTFNLGWELTSPELLAQTIASSQADIVAVQEVTAQAATILTRELAAIYPYRILDPAVATTGLLSKLPIVSYQWLTPPRGRPYPHVVVDQGSAHWHIFPIHFYPPGILWWERLHVPRGLIETALEGEVAYLLQQVAGVSGPVVILGDFNMSDQSDAYTAITASLQDSFRQAGIGLGRTFPNNFRLAGMRIPFPFVRIDYVFHSSHLETTSARVQCIEEQSDHCAVLVGLSLRTNHFLLQPVSFSGSWLSTAAGAD